MGKRTSKREAPPDSSRKVRRQKAMQIPPQLPWPFQDSAGIVVLSHHARKVMLGCLLSDDQKKRAEDTFLRRLVLLAGTEIADDALTTDAVRREAELRGLLAPPPCAWWVLRTVFNRRGAHGRVHRVVLMHKPIVVGGIGYHLGVDDEVVKNQTAILAYRDRGQWPRDCLFAFLHPVRPA